VQLILWQAGQGLDGGRAAAEAFEGVDLPLRRVLFEANQPIEQVFLLHTGVASLCGTWRLRRRDCDHATREWWVSWAWKAHRQGASPRQQRSKARACARTPTIRLSRL
jgi:hypothetical protein